MRDNHAGFLVWLRAACSPAIAPELELDHDERREIRLSQGRAS